MEGKTKYSLQTKKTFTVHMLSNILANSLNTILRDSKYTFNTQEFLKLAEQAKRRKYENLDSSFIFVPFGVETLGPWGPEARALFKELSKRVIESTGDPRAGSYLGQRISLAIQRGNAASILGTVPRCGGFEDVLDFI
ncbi:jg25131 [Pararge aegeria aegeria]|uniref:Jg25131 protein n=1 Tax=Pararge aegeria aegeria TaxID=348720 RepID=A0A8S4SKA6_9NEOP|nr:jg25131 [Pararge aegeria aegeria]